MASAPTTRDAIATLRLEAAVERMVAARAARQLQPRRRLRPRRRWRRERVSPAEPVGGSTLYRPTAAPDVLDPLIVD
jgi:hypothetical protein